MKRAWGIAGLSAVCKTARAGFDSLPRLHIWIERNPLKGSNTKRLLLHHWNGHIEYKTKANILTDKVAILSKTLSAYKRHFGPLPDDITDSLPTIQEVDRDWRGEMTNFRDKL